MNRKKLIDGKSTGITSVVLSIIVVVIVAVAGAGAFVYYASIRKAPSAPSPTTSSSTSTTSTTTATTTPAATSSSSSTTSTTTSSSSSSSSSTTASCTSSSSSSSSLQTQMPDLVPLFGNFSRMTIVTNDSIGGSNFTLVDSYKVISSSTDYVVNFSLDSPPSTLIVGTATFLKNGTATHVMEYIDGILFVNDTGAAAENDTALTFVSFYLDFSSSSLASKMVDAGFLKIANETTVKIGSVDFNVTNYEPKSLPIVLDECGVNTTFDSFNLQTGSSAGTNLELITYLSFKEETGGGETIALAMQITSAQRA